MQVVALQCVYHQMTAAGTQKQGGGASGREGATKAQRVETDGRMTIRSRVVENLLVVAAVVVGMPLIVGCSWGFSVTATWSGSTIYWQRDYRCRRGP